MQSISREQGTPMKFRDGPAAVSYPLLVFKKQAFSYSLRIAIAPAAGEKAREIAGRESEDLPLTRRFGALLDWSDRCGS